MSSDINFSELWKGQSAAVPDVNELIGKAKALRSKTRNRLLGLSLLLLATAGFIVWIWIAYKPQLYTTITGICLVLAAIVMSVIHNTGSLRLLMKRNESASSASYLEELLQIKQKQEYMQRVIMSLYFILLSLGIALYMIEYTLKMTTVMAVSVYVLTAAWIAFNWFYLRPRTIKKQQEAIIHLISELERINKQLSNG